MAVTSEEAQVGVWEGWGGGCSQARPPPRRVQQRAAWALVQTLEEVGVGAESQEGKGQHRHLAPCGKRLRDGGVSKGASGYGLSTHGPSTPGMQGLGAANCDMSSAAAVMGQHGLGLWRTDHLEVGWGCLQGG